MPRKAPGVTQYETKKGEKLWRYVVDAGHDPKTGKRRQKKVSGFKTQREAAAAQEKTRQLLDNGGRVDADKITFGEHLLDWIERRSREGNERTAAAYLSVINNTLLPRLGHIKLQKLHQSHLTDLYEGLIAGTHSHTGKPLMPATVNRIHAVVSTALKDAAKRDLVIRNVATLADAPRVDNRKHQEGFWTADELNLFFAEIRGHTYEVCFRLLGLTGMRRGEGLGLRWEDVDLDRGVLHIRKQLVYDHSADGTKSCKLDEPKTKRSRRNIAIGPDVVAMLRDHHRAQLASHVESRVGNVMGLVVTGASGFYANPSSVAKAFKKIVDEIPVRPITIHGLRHTHATLLLSAGRNPLEVSERLGHSSVAFTLDNYGHVIPNDAASVAKAGEAALMAENRWQTQQS